MKTHIQTTQNNNLKIFYLTFRYTIVFSRSAGQLAVIYKEIFTNIYQKNFEERRRDESFKNDVDERTRDRASDTSCWDGHGGKSTPRRSRF